MHNTFGKILAASAVFFAVSLLPVRVSAVSAETFVTYPVETIVPNSVATFEANPVEASEVDSVVIFGTDSLAMADSIPQPLMLHDGALKTDAAPLSPYELPYSVTGNSYDWHRLWINTASLSSAFVGTLLVLECLPEDATSWNRAELQDVPLFKRWHNHVIKKGPEWDHDKFYFNYLLHPYAGAAYFMAARSCGFNFWRSALYGTIVSTVGWEFGVEAFMERPSIQDLFITPIVGSCIGEGFYHTKRWLVDNDYRLFGSPVLGGILAFIVDPVNELTGFFLGNPAKRIAHERAAPRSAVHSSLSMVLTITNSYKGFTLVSNF